MHHTHHTHPQTPPHSHHIHHHTHYTHHTHDYCTSLFRPCLSKVKAFYTSLKLNPVYWRGRMNSMKSVAGGGPPPSFTMPPGPWLFTVLHRQNATSLLDSKLLHRTADVSSSSACCTQKRVPRNSSAQISSLWRSECSDVAATCIQIKQYGLCNLQKQTSLTKRKWYFIL